MTKIWAHRGASAYAPENTLEAFALAIQQGAEGVEFDVQLSNDGAIVVIHDETLERTTNGGGYIKDYDLRTLQKLNAAAGHRGASAYIPTLAEVLALLQPTALDINIELKTSVVDYPGIEEKVLEQIEIYGLEERVVLSSFNHYTLHRLAKLGARSEIALLFSDPIYRPWQYAQDFGAAAIHPWLYHITSKKWVRKAHEAGMLVRPWTVDKKGELRRMIRWGVDALFTNRPDVGLAMKAEVAAEPAESEQA
jgi:glycerophosphoryl diester phosphodiesterase